MIKSKQLLLFIISFFGTGRVSRKMPGTVGSFFAMLLLLCLPRSPTLALIIALLLFCIGWRCCDTYIIKRGYEQDRDPGYVVIDEACGISTTAAIAYSFGLVNIHDILLGFLLFRTFDIFKPFPIGCIERVMKSRDSTVGLGIMLDDLLAGIYAGVTQVMLTMWIL
ncbi:MAG: phosphatidylglycerophosphatase A [Alphaproteobacteria bacterium]|nr:phosphatidylglycerophosphatase A [Alphaproteobacteria bacterium]